MNKKVLSVSKITGIINLLISVFVFVAINTFLHPCSGEKSMRRPDSGEILVDGKNIFTELREKECTKLRSTKIGYMMQGNVLIPELDVLNNIRMPAEI